MLGLVVFLGSQPSPRSGESYRQARLVLLGVRASCLRIHHGLLIMGLGDLSKFWGSSLAAPPLGNCSATLSRWVQDVAAGLRHAERPPCNYSLREASTDKLRTGAVVLMQLGRSCFLGSARLNGGRT